MKTFCRYLKDQIQNELHINVDVFISRKKKHVHFTFERSLMSYLFYDELITFVYKK